MLIDTTVLHPVYIVLEILILTVNVVQPKLFCYPGQYQKSNLIIKVFLKILVNEY